ncbi:MAG: hypothetical protein JWP96_1451 [Polaromonas sp.]|nr:hypothetical protein [Polaromonas sp.]
MQKDAYRLWITRIVTFAISALAAASVAYWGLKGWRPNAPSTAPTVILAQMSPASSQAIARALGGGLAAAPAVSGAPPATSRYALVGVLAGNSRTGAALISVDGQEAKPVRVGNLVDENVVLQSVNGRSAILSSAAEKPAKFTLELPPLSQ